MRPTMNAFRKMLVLAVFILILAPISNAMASDCPPGQGDCHGLETPSPPNPMSLDARKNATLRTAGTEWITDSGFNLDQYLYRSGSPIEFTINVDQSISQSSVYLTLSTYDVDYDGGSTPERDKAYINGNYLGYLTGSNGAWSINTFTVPTSLLNAPGANTVTVEIDTLNGGWAVTVDYGIISTSGTASNNVTINSGAFTVQDTDSDSKYNTITAQVNATATNSGSYALNGALYSSSGQLIGWASTTVSLTGGVATDIPLNWNGEDINCLQANGPYQLKDVTIYNTSDTSVRAFNSSLCSSGSYLYSDFEACTSTVPLVIAKSPDDGALDVSVKTTVTATFNLDMDAATITNTNFTLATNAGVSVPGTVTYNSSTRVATFTPSSNLTGDTQYRAVVGTGVKSLGGVALASAVDWYFTTGSSCSDVATKAYTFQSGTPAKAEEVNQNFDILYSQINSLNCLVQSLKDIICRDNPTASVCN